MACAPAPGSPRINFPNTNRTQKPTLVKPNKFALFATASLIQSAFAVPGTLLWMDNFDAANTTNFDGAPLAGRLSGKLGLLPDSVARASGTQQYITNNQLEFRGGRIRFQTSATGPWYDWAGSLLTATPAAMDAGAEMLADGGMKIEFDYVPTDVTSANWINVSIGFPGTGEPQRINNAETDYGVLLRNSGGAQRFKNGAVLGDGTPFPAIATSRHCEYLYAFDSYADGTTVRARVIVDGVKVAEDTFNWTNNGGQLYFNVECNQPGTLADNLAVSTIPTLFEFNIDNVEFSSALGTNQLVSALIGSTFARGEEITTYEFEAGAGDDDNAKFVLAGEELQTGSYDFKQDADQTVYQIRVKGTGSVSGGTQTRELTLTLFKDDDGDDLLDPWELAFAGNLTSLNGLASGPGPGAGTGDFDGDGISDYEEYQYSLGLYPDISPILADTDADGLTDGDEISPPFDSLRPATNPLLADTDKDGLGDLEETNTGTYVSATDTGTSATNPDFDLDGARDGFEVSKGSNPTDFASRPVLPPAFKLVRVTDDASTGISSSITYTHKISGGDSAVINGVTLDELDTVNPVPANFTWEASSTEKNQISPADLRTWVPANGEVTGEGAISMYGTFAFANGDPGSFQTYTLSGLTVGESYKLKIFIRTWEQAVASFRPVDFEFTNGASVAMPFGALATDRPGIVLENDNNNSAYYVSYDYVAAAPELILKAAVPISAPAASGSFHLYGLTNELTSTPSPEFRITGFTRAPSGEITLDFIGAPSSAFVVTKSPDLVTPFGPLSIPLSVSTNGAGIGQAVIPASETSDDREFYRIER